MASSDYAGPPADSPEVAEQRLRKLLLLRALKRERCAEGSNVTWVDFRPGASTPELPATPTPDEVAELGTIAKEAVIDACKDAFARILRSAATKLPNGMVGDTFAAYLTALRTQLEHDERSNPFSVAVFE